MFRNRVKLNVKHLYIIKPNFYSMFRNRVKFNVKHLYTIKPKSLFVLWLTLDLLVHQVDIGVFGVNLKVLGKGTWHNNNKKKNIIKWQDNRVDQLKKGVVFNGQLLPISW